MWMIFLPYVFLVTLYILAFGVHRTRPPQGTVLSAFFKCLPIVYLLLLVAFAPRVTGQHGHYKFYVGVGLLLSLGGDWCLNWMTTHESLFLPGIGFFALAQISYTFAFGFDDFGGQTVFMFTIAGLCALKLLLPDVKPRRMKPLVALYIVLLGVMGWRATVRYKVARSLDTWLAMAGAVSFIVSDFTIGYNRWKVHFPRAVLLIMMTYYLAQMLFAVSVLVPSWRALRMFSVTGV